MSSGEPQSASRGDEDAANTEFDRAFQLSELGRYRDAAKVALRGLAILPDAVHGLNILAFVQSRLADHEAARATSARALALEPDDAWAHYTRGIVIWTDGDGEGAIACFDRAIELWPESAYMHAIKAELLGTLGRPAEGLEEIEQALTMEPDSVAHRLEKIDLLRDLDRASAADELVAEALRLAPDSPLVHRRAADTALRQGRPDDALRWFRSALAADPDDHGAREGIVEALEAGSENRIMAHSNRILGVGLIVGLVWRATVGWHGAVVLALLAFVLPAVVRDVSVALHPLGRVAMPTAERILVASIAAFALLALTGLVAEVTPLGSHLRAPMFAAIVIAGMLVIVRVNFAHWAARSRHQVTIAGLITVLAVLVCVLAAVIAHLAER